MRSDRRSRTTAIALLAGAMLLAACSTDPSATGDAGTEGITVPSSAAPPRSIVALPPGTSWQLQLDGEEVDLAVLDHVDNPHTMFDVDLVQTPAATIEALHERGAVVVCYLEIGGWEWYRPDADTFPEEVLGGPVDGYPEERYLDIRRIDVLLPIIAARLDLAVEKGCDGVDPDLDDSYLTDTGFPLTMDDQLRYNRAVADAAHQRGLAIGLKNGATPDGEFVRRMSAFTDFALNEECHSYDECDPYTVYLEQGKAVFQVQYLDGPLDAAAACAANAAAGFDGLVKLSSATLAARPRIGCTDDAWPV